MENMDSQKEIPVMKRFAVALLVVVWLFPVALHAAPYGTYDVRKVFVLGEKADARKSVTVNTEYLDRMIKDLTCPRGPIILREFDSDADRQRARNDAGGLVYILNIPCQWWKCGQGAQDARRCRLFPRAQPRCPRCRPEGGQALSRNLSPGIPTMRPFISVTAFILEIRGRIG